MTGQGIDTSNYSNPLLKGPNTNIIGSGFNGYKSDMSEDSGEKSAPVGSGPSVFTAEGQNY